MNVTTTVTSNLPSHAGQSTVQLGATADEPNFVSVVLVLPDVLEDGAEGLTSRDLPLGAVVKITFEDVTPEPEEAAPVAEEEAPVIPPQDTDATPVADSASSEDL